MRRTLIILALFAGATSYAAPSSLALLRAFCLAPMETIASLTRKKDPEFAAARASAPSRPIELSTEPLKQSLGSNALLAEFPSVARAEKTVESLLHGDTTFLTELDRGPLPENYDPREWEWGICKGPNGKAYLVTGQNRTVTLPHTKELEVIGHSHPLKRLTPVEGKMDIESLSKAIADTEPLFPSGFDIKSMIGRGIVSQTIFTPYVHLGKGQIGYVEAGTRRPLVRMKISGLKHEGENIYSLDLTAESDGKPFWKKHFYYLEFHPGGMISEAPAKKYIPGAPRPKPPANIY